MKQLTYIRRGRLEWRDVVEPRLIEDTDAIVRPFAAARCDGDHVPLFHSLSGALRAGVACHYIDPLVVDAFGKQPYKGPYAFGHECVAEVLRCGNEVRSVRPGDHVIVPWSISCGVCEVCASGLTTKCETRGTRLANAYGFGDALGNWGGLVSDIVRVPFADRMLIAVPTGVAPESLASASDNLPDAWRTVGPFLQRRPGAPVLVVGGSARSIGLYAAGLAVAAGSSRVDYVDTDTERLAIAQALGANPVQAIDSSRWYRRASAPLRGGYPITVDASANRSRLVYAVRCLAPGGHCTSVGYYFYVGTKLPLWRMYVNGGSFHTGLSHPHVDTPAVLELVASGRFKPERVTTLLAAWDDAPRAFLERTTKVVVHRSPLGTAGTDSVKPVQDVPRHA
jgi:threonine dehydrogenase-like Zn-dependent dehydrogenase